MNLITWEQARRGDVIGIDEQPDSYRGNVEKGFYVLRKQKKISVRKLLRRAMICGARRRERPVKDTRSMARKKVKIFDARLLRKDFKIGEHKVLKFGTDFEVVRFDNVKEARRLVMLEDI